MRIPCLSCSVDLLPWEPLHRKPIQGEPKVGHGARLNHCVGSLQGQALYTKASKGDKAALATLDKQIFRLIGKSITLAAYVRRFCNDV